MCSCMQPFSVFHTGHSAWFCLKHFSSFWLQAVQNLPNQTSNLLWPFLKPVQTAFLLIVCYLLIGILPVLFFCQRAYLALTFGIRSIGVKYAVGVVIEIKMGSLQKSHLNSCNYSQTSLFFKISELHFW